MMDTFMLLLMLIFLISAITTIVMKLITKSPKVVWASRLTLGLYILLVLLIGIFPYDGVENTLEIVAFAYFFGALFVLIWKFLLQEEHIKQWLIAGAVISGVTGVIELFVNPNQSWINNFVDFGIIFITCLLIITVVSMCKKNEYGRLLCKVLGGAFVINGLMFSFIPPLSVSTIFSSIIIVILVGALPGIAIMYSYKKLYPSIDKISEMMDDYAL